MQRALRQNSVLGNTVESSVVRVLTVSREEDAAFLLKTLWCMDCGQSPGGSCRSCREPSFGLAAATAVSRRLRPSGNLSAHRISAMGFVGERLGTLRAYPGLNLTMPDGICCKLPANVRHMGVCRHSEGFYSSIFTFLPSDWAFFLRAVWGPLHCECPHTWQLVEVFLKKF